MNQFDDAGIARAQAEINKIQAEIRAAKAEIARRTFWEEYTYEEFDSRNLGSGNSSCIITIDTSIYHSRPQVGSVQLPMQDIRVTSISAHKKRTSFAVIDPGIQVSIIGNTASVAELINNKNSYRAKVWFKNLRYDTTYSAWGNVSADVLRVEIFHVNRPNNRE